MSFRKQIYLSLIMLSILPVLVISGFALHLSITSVVNSSRTALNMATEVISNQVDHYFTFTRNSLASYAASAHDTDKNELVEELLLLVSSNSSYTGAFVTDSSGTVTASTFPAHEGTSYKDNDFFTNTVNLKSDDVYIEAVESKTMSCAIDGALVFSTRIALENGGESVVVLASDLVALDSIAKQEKSYNSAMLCIYTSDSRLLYHQGGSAATEQIEDKVSGYVESYNTLEGSGLLLKLTIKKTELYFSVYILFAIMCAIVIVIIVAVAVIAKRITGNMTKPLIALQEAFGRAGNNRIYAPCTPVGSHEFVTLAECFNNMMATLNRKQEDTERAIEHLRVSEEELKRHNKMLKLERDRTNLLINRDSISGVYSRSYFERTLDNALKGGRPGAVIFIDIDNFKHINDSFGHDFGDKCLRELGAAFSSSELEHELVARISADEFMILKYGLKDDATECAAKIFNMLQKPFIVENILVRLQGSIGVTLFPQDGEDVNILLKNADLAKNQAKLWGKNQSCYYQPNMTKELKTHMDIMEMLRMAHITGDVYLVYQPEIDVKTEQTVAFETLCRAKSDKLGFVTPAEFIPLAESSGLIVPLGEWILKTACTFAKSIINDDIKFDYISVNVSQVQINQENFVDFVFKTLDEVKYPAHKLQLEITESALASSTQMIIKKLRKLHSRGVRIALDDFGTGYSSLNYLVQLPIDTVKIDKSFIDHICTDEKTRVMCETIITLGHRLGLHIVAEGTETEEQVAMLKKLGCDIVQGYYYSRPIASGAAAEYARRDKL